MPRNDGKTVGEILAGKRASILKAPLDTGSPSWDDIRHLTWEDIVERARQREPGFGAIKKLLSNRRFNK